MAVSPEVAKLVLDELARRNIAAVADEEGGYVLAIPESITRKTDGSVDVSCRNVRVNLDNLSRDFEQDRDVGRIARFVDVCTAAVKLPASWAEAEPRIRWQLEPADMAFGKTLLEKVSDRAVRALVHVDATEMQILWLTAEMVAGWGKTPEDAWAAAGRNLSEVLAQTKLELTQDRSVGMLSTALSGFKAALLFCPALKAQVEPALGWPVLAVAPCRDFVYLFSPEARELFGKIGAITLEQYNEGGYPISTEVYEVSDDGVHAIGAFQQGPETED
jgi:hypothetical protein